MRESLKAMNSINGDLRFAVETENGFANKRLPTLSFEIWLCKEGIRHSHYKKRDEKSNTDKKEALSKKTRSMLS